MTDAHDLSDGPELAVTETLEKAAEKHKAEEHQAFAAKLAKRSPPDPIDRAEIEKARKRTKARTPRIAMHIEDRGTAGSVVYPDHSDDEGHDYRLADAFGTRSRQFVRGMLKGLENATGTIRWTTILVLVVPINWRSMPPSPSLTECGHMTKSKQCWQRTWL
jgi:hypothetical protein